jgi:wobble nucleotide-excising tRNase
MAIEKFIKIANIGRFTDMAAEGDVQFRKSTLIYGDNGSGKTTLCGIFRSLKLNDPAFISERATLGFPDRPKVSLLVDRTNINYTEGSWSSHIPEIEIFDDTFVTENVYAGDVVDIEQRKNLYQVVVGPIAVQLARRIDEIDSLARACSRQITKIETQLREKIQSPFDINSFLKLAKVDDVQDQISKLTRDLSAARNATQVVNRPQLSSYTVPKAPREILAVLNTNISTVSEDAKKQVQEHISHLDRNGESWLKQGLEYVHDKSCPFCAQDLSTSNIYNSFISFFSDEYEKQVIRIQRSINQIEQIFSEEALNRLNKTSLENEGHIQTWSDLVDINYADFPLNRIESTWRELRTILIESLKTKLNNPARTFIENPKLEAAIQDYELVSKEILSKNSSIRKANEKIAEVKKDAAGANQAEIEQNLRYYRNSQIRQEPEIISLCEELINDRLNKKELDEEKTKAKEELSNQAENVLKEYEQDINNLLASFGASFRLKGTRPNFAGGRASSTYNLSLNNVQINVGDSNTPRGTPCFRTALSSGDKSTLALSFFLARLSRDPDLGNKIVVLDDPLTSLDSFRISFTQQEISRLCEIASQVIILSHDPFFLKGIDDLFQASNIKTLRLTRRGNTQSIREWDVSQFCLSEAHKDYFILRKFIEDGLPDESDLRTIIRAIRPYLEGYLRHRYPDRFTGKIMIGEMLSIIRNSASTDEISILLPKLQELEDINTFSRTAHHGSDGSPTQRTTETEVMSFVERTLNFVRGSA